MSDIDSKIWFSVAVAAAICTSTYSYFFGAPADERVEVARLAKFAVAPESIRVSTAAASLELRPIEVQQWGEGRVRYTPGWVLLRTAQWMILPNAEEGKSLCPGLLGDFIDAHRPSGSRTAWTLRNVDALVSSHKNATVDLRVHVPRPASAPKELANCSALSYDADKQLLMYEGRPVAVIAEEQTFKVAPVKPPRSVPRFIY